MYLYYVHAGSLAAKLEPLETHFLCAQFPIGTIVIVCEPNLFC
jgi:hypothetical protein